MEITKLKEKEADKATHIVIEAQSMAGKELSIVNINIKYKDRLDVRDLAYRRILQELVVTGKFDKYNSFRSYYAIIK